MRKRWIAGIGVAVVVLLAIWGCRRPTPPAPTTSPDGYSLWAPTYLREALRHKDFILVNVHVPFEGRIASTDAEIPYDQLAADPSQFLRDPNQKIVLYCRSGRMSEIAAKSLVEHGYTHVAILQGGMLAWSESGGSLLK